MWSVLHLLNLPAKKVVQKIANIKMKKFVMRSNYAMSGIEFVKDSIASFKALFFAIIRKGLRILSIRKAFKEERSYYEKANEKSADNTITKSSTFSASSM